MYTHRTSEAAACPPSQQPHTLPLQSYGSTAQRTGDEACTWHGFLSPHAPHAQPSPRPLPKKGATTSGLTDFHSALQQLRIPCPQPAYTCCCAHTASLLHAAPHYAPHGTPGCTCMCTKKLPAPEAPPLACRLQTEKPAAKKHHNARARMHICTRRKAGPCHTTMPCCCCSASPLLC